jgi:hypothetical protein
MNTDAALMEIIEQYSFAWLDLRSSASIHGHKHALLDSHDP